MVFFWHLSPRITKVLALVLILVGLYCSWMLLLMLIGLALTVFNGVTTTALVFSWIVFVCIVSISFGVGVVSAWQTLINFRQHKYVSSFLYSVMPIVCFGILITCLMVVPLAVYAQ